LLKNKDTFYFEYFNKSQLFYKNKPLIFNSKFKCHNRYEINHTQNYVVQDNGIENYTIIDDLKNHSIFQYYINDDNITLYEEPYLNLYFYIYDMKSITPSIKYEFIIDDLDIKKILKGEKE